MIGKLVSIIVVVGHIVAKIYFSINGIITYANETFLEISGYTEDELIGQKHSIVRHPDMPSSIFENLWNTIKEKKKWSGNVKNLRKDKGFYWVNATISGVYKDDILVEYKSIQDEYKPILNMKYIIKTFRL